MLYFIPWVVLLFVAILAIPIAAMMEKRKLQSSYPAGEEYGGGGDDDEPLEPMDDDGGDILQEGAIEEAPDADDPFGTGAPDDFSAFEEEFK